MILKRTLILSFIVFSNIVLMSQNDTCMSPSEDDDLLSELNAIDKCVIEKEEKEITTPKKNRYLRIRKTNYYANLRKNINDLKKEKKEPVKEVIAKEVYLGEVTQEPILLLANQNRSNLKESLARYVSDNLVYPESLRDKNIEGIVWSSFVIDTKGEVKNIVTLGPIGGKLLEDEAARLLKALPKFTPGELDGEKVNVKHLMAIKFELN